MLVTSACRRFPTRWTSAPGSRPFSSVGEAEIIHVLDLLRCACGVNRNRKFIDSPLEGDGFELLVPRHESPRFPNHPGMIVAPIVAHLAKGGSWAPVIARLTGRPALGLGSLLSRTVFALTTGSEGSSRTLSGHSHRTYCNA